MEDRDIIRILHEKVGYIPWDILEEFILNRQHILRPIVGHCFETWFDILMRINGHKIESVGGDDVVDQILEGKTLQLKTIYKNGSREGERVAYSLHKTHGIEKRPYNLYKPEDFADFLIGLHPNWKIIICPRERIPLNRDYPRRGWGEYLADPVYFDWNTEWINRFDFLKVKIQKYPAYNPKLNKIFPRLGEITRLSDIDIVKTLLKPENFRVLNQNIQGTIREWHFYEYAKKQGIQLYEPDSNSESRIRIKVDFVLPDGRLIQVKGRTKSLCRGDIIGVEVKGSHGRIPQRLYKREDFHLLVVVIDPGSILKEFAKAHGVDPDKYNYYVIPVEDLRSHERSEEWGEEYLKDIFRFRLSDYKINDFSLLRNKVTIKRKKAIDLKTFLK